MKNWIGLVVLSLGGLVASCGGGTGGGTGPNCRTGCRCGNSCISCRYTCRHGTAVDEYGNVVTTPAEPDLSGPDNTDAGYQE